MCSILWTILGFLVYGRVVTHLEGQAVPPVPSFNSRTMGALNKIAEEHWKRQMKQEQEEDELVSEK